MMRRRSDSLAWEMLSMSDFVRHGMPVGEGGFTNCWDLEEVQSSAFQARRADISNPGGVIFRTWQKKRLQDAGGLSPFT